MLGFRFATDTKKSIAEGLTRALRSRQRKSWDLINAHCKNQKKRKEVLLEHISPLLKSDSLLLDAGCGKGRSTPTDYRQHVSRAFGIDVSLSDLKENSTIHSCIQGDVEVLPFRGQVFDVVVSQWCIEHLKNPVGFFHEVGRTLKPSGYFVFFTPNMYHYITLLSSVTSVGVHRLFNKILLNIDESDTFPTFYRANTPMKLDKLLSGCGFIRRQITMYEEPPWLWAFSPLMCKLALKYRDVITRSEVLRMLCGVICGVYQKKV